MSNCYFSICSLFYVILLTFEYFRKIKNKKNSLVEKSYAALIITNLIGLVLAIMCYFTVSNCDIYPVINFIISRLYLVYLIVWISIFTFYIYLISTKNKKHKLAFNILLIFSIIFSILAYILPLQYVHESNIVYSYGLSANCVYLYSELCIILCLIFMFLNPKNIKGTKYAPLFIFIAGGTLIMVIQSIYPELLLITSMETFSTFLIYFTIENNEKSIEKQDK